MPILRVFPRKTNATPQDDYVCIGSPGLFIPEDISEIHISVTFTWDLQYAEILADQWSRYGNVKIGGPATGMRGENFTPGLYLKHGYIITSRGCHNHCWFCSVPKREGSLRELPITDGWLVLDDNVRPDRVLLKVVLDTTAHNHGQAGLPNRKAKADTGTKHDRKAVSYLKAKGYDCTATAFGY